MEYRWNISQNGRHYCFIGRNTYTPALRKEFKEQLEASFPTSEGYEISVALCKKTSQEINLAAEAEELATA